MDKLENIQRVLSFLVHFCESLCDYRVSFDKTTWWSSSLPSTFSLSRLSDPIFCLIRSRAMLLLCFCFLVVATSTTSSPLSEDVLRALHSQIEKVGLRFYPTINLYSNVRPFIISLVVETHHSNSVFPYRLVLVPVCCIMFSMKNVYELISLSDTSVFELMFSLLVGLEWPDC